LVDAEYKTKTVKVSCAFINTRGLNRKVAEQLAAINYYTWDFE
jgi:hypothetical protein